MDERTGIMVTALLGAVVGGLVGFLLFTERGRQLRGDLQPQLEGLLDEAMKLQQTVERVSSAAMEGWQSMSAATQGQGDRAAGATH